MRKSTPFIAATSMFLAGSCASTPEKATAPVAFEKITSTTTHPDKARNNLVTCEIISTVFPISSDFSGPTEVIAACPRDGILTRKQRVKIIGTVCTADLRSPYQDTATLYRDYVQKGTLPVVAICTFSPIELANLRQNHIG
jgi:hypothetical protein